MNKNVCISYNWQEPSSGIVNNWLTKTLEDAEISYSVDRKDCLYHDSIEEFERKIGEADMIIAVVSKPFLASVHCMYEMALVFAKGGEMIKRLFFIGIEEVETNEQIVDRWENELNQAVEELSRRSIAREPFEKRKQQLQLICDNLGKFLVYYRDINREDFSKVSKDNFQLMINKLQNRIDEIKILEEDIL